MKTPSTLRLTALVASFLLHPSAVILAQGPLTPPGVPAPTMKTLDQLEPRTPIASAPFTISASGSYYLTANLTVPTGTAIFITADNVALDLHGFTISSTASPASGTAVLISGTRRNVSIKNGHIRGTTTFSAGTFTSGGFLDGIANSSSTSANLRVSEVDVAGVADDAIYLAPTPSATQTIIERCAVSICGGFGLRATKVTDCLVETAGGGAIAAEIATNSSGEAVGGNGVYALSVVENCRGISDGGDGIYGGRVSNSFGTSVSGNGIYATKLVQNCEGVSSSGTGIFGRHAVLNSTGTSSTGVGLSCDYSAMNCIGKSTSLIGLVCDSATNCYGQTTSGTYGLIAYGTANSSRGSGPSVAISAEIAIGCTVDLGTVSSSKKYLGTP